MTRFTAAAIVGLTCFMVHAVESESHGPSPERRAQFEAKLAECNQYLQSIGSATLAPHQPHTRPSEDQMKLIKVCVDKGILPQRPEGEHRHHDQSQSSDQPGASTAN